MAHETQRDSSTTQHMYQELVQDEGRLRLPSSLLASSEDSPVCHSVRTARGVVV